MNKHKHRIGRDPHSVLTRLLNHFLSIVDGEFSDYSGLKRAWIEGREIVWRESSYYKSAVSTYISEYRDKVFGLKRELSREEIKEYSLQMVNLSKQLCISFPDKKEGIIPILIHFLYRTNRYFRFFKTGEIDNIIIDLNSEIEEEYNRHKKKIETINVKPEPPGPKPPIWPKLKKIIIPTIILLFLFFSIYYSIPYATDIKDKITEFIFSKDEITNTNEKTYEYTGRQIKELKPTDWSCEYYSSLLNKEEKVQDKCISLCNSFDSEYDKDFRCTGDKTIFCRCLVKEKILIIPQKLSLGKKAFIDRVLEGIGQIEIPEIKLPEEKPIDDSTFTIERLVYSKTNEQRNNFGLSDLRENPKLSEIARDHSLDMVQRDFFSHDNPDGEDPTARAIRHGLGTEVRKGNVIWIGIGENIGLMPTGDVFGYGYVSSEIDIANAMIDGWMSSSGHRANILNPDYESIGVGVARKGGDYYLTQDFQ